MTIEKDKRLLEFSFRINEALDDFKCPPKGSGRQTWVAKKFNVSQKGARKWLEAESMPRPLRQEEIADTLGVERLWLMFGPPNPKIKNKAHWNVILPDKAEWKTSLLSKIMNEVTGSTPVGADKISNAANILSESFAQLEDDILKTFKLNSEHETREPSLPYATLADNEAALLKAYRALPQDLQAALLLMIEQMKSK